MTAPQFLLTPPPKVLIDIEALYDLPRAVLARYEKDHGKPFPPTWLGSEYPLQMNVSPKYGKILIEYMKEPGFFASLPIIDYALRAIYRMESLGFEVFIVVSATAGNLVVAEQLEWLSKKLSEIYQYRILVSRDKTLLIADYLIDVQPNCLESYDIFKKRGHNGFARPVFNPQPAWKLILLDRPFNQQDRVAGPFHSRFSDWKRWTSAFPNVLNLALRESTVSFAHGSSNSLDEDRFFVFPRALIPRVDGDRMRAILDDGHVDANLIDFSEDGYVCENHKGQNDEIHNGLHSTYPLHPQRFPLPTNFAPVMQRAVPLKFYNAMRRIFIRLTETEETRSVAKAVLRDHDPHAAPKVFRSFDFAHALTIVPLGIGKYFAFQLGQVLGLLEGREFFTKNDISAAYPQLTPFITRNHEESLATASIINEFRDRMLNATRHLVLTVGPNFTGLLQVSKELLESTSRTEWNPMLEQCNGMVLDFKDLSIVAYPPAHVLAEETLKALPTSWPRDPSASSPDAVVPSSSSISVGKDSHGLFIISSQTGFEGESCRKVEQWLARKPNSSRWPWASYYLFFHVFGDQIELCAARSKFSHKFVSQSALDELEQGL